MDTTLDIDWAHDISYRHKIRVLIDIEYTKEMNWWYVDAEGQCWPKDLYE